ncbi:MAG: NADPH:quinone oxidoreductase family protein [Pseudomonadota bacterium]
MKAIVCHDFAPIDELRYEEIDSPTARRGEVVIDVEAAGVNFPDGLLVQGLYQMRPDLPFVPGGEVCGTISSIGEDVKNLELGQRVIGICQLGGFAEHVALPAEHTIPIPDKIASDEAAALTTAYATAHHALKQRAALKENETVLVTGASGGTGLAAVQIAKAMGAKVIAACSTDEKCALAKQYGADILVNYNTSDLKDTIKDLTRGKGVDVVYECVGDDIFAACTRVIAWAGRLLVIGFASGHIPKFPVNLALVKGYSVIGVFWSSFAQHEPQLFAENMKELLGWYLDGTIRVHIDRRFTLDQTVEALDYVNQRLVKGKVVVIP